jgi:hypothetical protein
MIKRYPINKHNSTVCGYPGRNFDWSKFCWDGSEIHKSPFKGERNRKAPLPYVDDFLIGENSQYLHVPYDWAKSGTIYRVRPNESMRAGKVYRGHKILKQRAVKQDGVWYWELKF